MGKYLKKFETQAAYEAAQSSLILPNVSLTVDNNTVHYNPSTPPTPTETRLVVKYNVSDTSEPTRIWGGWYEYFSAIEIDGVEQSSIVDEYTFNTLGEHTVKYTLIDPTTIGTETFYYCSSLTSIDIPNSVTSIGDSAFKNCSSLTSVDIPNSVTSIDSDAFAYCSSLTSCTLGSGVTTIGYNTFSGCNLTSINIPNSLVSIGDEAFCGCHLDAATVAAIEAINDMAFYCS